MGNKEWDQIFSVGENVCHDEKEDDGEEGGRQDDALDAGGVVHAGKGLVVL